MSLITDFPFHAFMADLKTRHTMEEKTGVSLYLLTSEDMKEMGTVEVRAPVGDEKRSAPWQPVMRNSETYATFYDTRMGNFNVKGFPVQPCSTCAQSRTTISAKLGNERCSGHFGYISMPRRYPDDPDRAQERMCVINPHLAEEVSALLQAKCFFCHKFRASRFDVERYRLGLLLADAGLTGEALNFLEVVGNLRGQQARQRRTVRENEEVISTVELMRDVAQRILEDHNIPPRQVVLAEGGEAGSASPTSPSASSEEAIRAAQEAIAMQARLQQYSGLPSLDIRQTICKQAMRQLREYNKKCSYCECMSPTVVTHSGHLFFHFTKANAEINLTLGALTREMLAEWDVINARHHRNYSYFLTTDAREHIKQLFQQEHEFLGLLFPHMGEPSIALPFDSPMPPHMLYKIFFLDKVLVPPLPVRLSSGLRVSDSGSLMPDDCTRSLSLALDYVKQVEVYNRLQLHPNTKPTDEQERAHEHNLHSLQTQINQLYSQTLESFSKKEGLFRMHMMGKRVNQACRSVISPDYLVESNEVLLPRPFARNLTYPEQVSSHSPARAALLKRCAINGPDVYPGATHLELRSTSGEIQFVDLHVAEPQRRRHVNRCFSMAQTGTLIVHRHVLDGDRLIFNRQPTLHKVSMLGYRAKVLSGLKTLRFHYVNGKSYNADFDGDEMNIHVPQSLEAKAELECLMDADLNYLVPTSGKPIRGLIQDHLAAAVLLTMRDKFFDRDTFTQFVFNGLAPYMQRQTAGQMTLTSLLPVPAIVFPKALWTGKQLVSVILKYVTGVFDGNSGGGGRKRSGLHLCGTSLIQPNVYTHTPLQKLKQHEEKGGKPLDLVIPTRHNMDDDRVVIQNSELLTGVVDKNQLGPSNLSIPHVIHEVYGPHQVGALFGAIGRVLSLSLQREGFSMGMDDMTLVLEERRSKLLEELDLAPLRLSDEDGVNEAKVMPRIMHLATQLQKEFVPGRLLVPFPHNQLLMMTVSGAKGSNTNAIQMALGLGQQLFDGRRVRPMNSGKTLPPFFLGDRRSRSFGYAMGRFASGIRPGEYTIHAMAGRDGLIDTAVKTSRSGHLQRCLIKGLESLVVQWDHSVRDANGAVIQFIYGGDGLDPVKASTLTAWDVVKDNTNDLAQRFGIDDALDLSEGGAISGGANETGAVPGEKRGRMDEELAALLEQKKAALLFNAHKNPLPEHMKKSLRQYLEKEATYTLFKKVSQVERWGKKGSLKERLEEKKQLSVSFYEDLIGDITTYKRARAFCDAGEPVGLLAAQAAGEPSTQMTLNTFHSAGSTVTHVTEGIPRLRELLIFASVKNPAVIVPVEHATPVDEAAITKAMGAGPAIPLADCLARDGETMKGYRYRVDRGDHGVVYTISLLFSKAALADKREKACMSEAEHVPYYLRALREFTKRVVGALSGTAGSGRGSEKEEAAGEDTDEGRATFGDAGLLRAPTKNPLSDGRELLKHEDEVEDEEEGGGSSSSDSSDGDDEHDRDAAPRAKKSRTAAHSKKKPQKSRKKRRLGSDEDEEEEEDDEDSASEGGRSDSVDSDENDVSVGQKRGRGGDATTRGSKHPLKCDEENDEEGFTTATTTDRIESAETYDRFQRIQASLRSGKYRVSLEPRTQPPQQLPDDFFIVEARIATSENMVAVLPDELERVLQHLYLPSWLPQFHTVSFTRKAEDPHSGEMVFQGPNATLDNVLQFLSILTVSCTSGAIQMHKARSTSIHHMVQTLGVESGYKALLDELTKLFKRYAVDYHHLTLIADAATNRGKWENFNFTGIISHSTSPLFQMTFASSKKFLHTAVTRGVGDDLRSFSASIMVGERPRVGTACSKVLPNPTLLHDIVERQFST